MSTRSVNLSMKTIPTINLLLILSILHQCWTRVMVPLGALVRTSEAQDGFEHMLRFAVKHINAEGKDPHLELYIDMLDDYKHRLSSSDVWKKVCHRVSTTGAAVLLGRGDSLTDTALDSFAYECRQPFINWHSSPAMNDMDTQFSVQMRPPLSKIVADIVVQRHWREITYVHDGREGLLNCQHVFNLIRAMGVRGITVELMQLPRKSSQFNKFVFDLHAQRISRLPVRPSHIIVDTQEPERTQSFVGALHRVTLKSPDDFHYILTDATVDLQEILKFERGFLNVTLVQSVQRGTPFFRGVRKEFKKYLVDNDAFDDSNIPADLAYVYDSILVAHGALSKMLRDDRSVFDNAFDTSRRPVEGALSTMTTCGNRSANTNVLLIGDRIAQQIIRNTFVAEGTSLTGRIQFSEGNGERKHFTLDVVDVTFETNSAFSQREVTPWIDGSGFQRRQRINSPPTDGRFALHQPNSSDVLIITTIISKPHVMLKEDHENIEKQNDKFEGFCVEMLAMIAEIVNFKYEIRLVADGGYGGVKGDGTWNGMIGELLGGKAHMAVAPLTITRVRERVVDFSKPFMSTGITIMVKKPDKQEFSVFAFMQPLSTEIWTLITICYLCISVVIFIVSRLSPYEWRVEESPTGGMTVSNDFSMYNCMWFTLAALMHQGTDILPKSVSGRIASSAWWFFTMIIMSSYTANLAAFLTSEKLSTSIGSVDDLASQTDIKYGIQGEGSTEAFFKDSTVATYRRMYQFMQAQVPPVFMSSYGEGIAKVRESKGRYAFLLEGTANAFANAQKPCDTMKVGAPLNGLGYGIATPIGSKLKYAVNMAILELNEMGALKKLENRWWYDRGQCEQGISKDSQSASLNLSKVAGIFYILIGGMCLSMGAACGELMYRASVETKTSQVTHKLTQIAMTMLSIVKWQMTVAGYNVACEGVGGAGGQTRKVNMSLAHFNDGGMSTDVSSTGSVELQATTLVEKPSATMSFLASAMKLSGQPTGGPAIEAQKVPPPPFNLRK